MGGQEHHQQTWNGYSKLQKHATRTVLHADFHTLNYVYGAWLATGSQGTEIEVSLNTKI